MFALANSGFLPKKLGELHPRYHTPWLAIVVIGVLSCVTPLFGRTILVWFINAGSFGTVLAYIFVPIAFLVLRYKEPELVRPYRLKYGKTVGVIAIVLGVGLFIMFFPPFDWALGTPEWVIIGMWSCVGVRVVCDVWTQTCDSRR